MPCRDIIILLHELGAPHPNGTPRPEDQNFNPILFPALAGALGAGDVLVELDLLPDGATGGAVDLFPGGAGGPEDFLPRPD